MQAIEIGATEGARHIRGLGHERCADRDHHDLRHDGVHEPLERGAAVSKRTDVREAFRRNWHRANRWNVAYYDLAVDKGFLMPMPTMDAKGLIRTAMMGG